MNVALELSKLETTESNIWQSYDPVLLTGVILPQYLKKLIAAAAAAAAAVAVAVAVVVVVTTSFEVFQDNIVNVLEV